jgi:hypothetical protein
MNASELNAINDEVEKYDRILLAAEKWGAGYKKDPQTHAQLIKAEARMARQLRVLFKDLATRLVDTGYIDWNKYFGLLRADFNVEVIINDDFYNTMDNEFFRVVFDTMALATTVGAAAGEAIYNVPLGISSTDEMIQRLTTKRLAYLVGKKVLPDGRVVDNPRPEYRISDKTRKDINQSIKTSISLGEDKPTAISRLMKVVDSPKRAAAIAQTETVNAYGSGLMGFGEQSGATGKEWQTIGADDICADNALQGVIPINDVFISGDRAPAAHPGCRCNLRLAYPNEYPAK